MLSLNLGTFPFSSLALGIPGQAEAGLMAKMLNSFVAKVFQVLCGTMYFQLQRQLRAD